jgi:hypothetical protein
MSSAREGVATRMGTGKEINRQKGRGSYKGVSKINALCDP